jgi:nitroreductase
VIRDEGTRKAIADIATQVWEGAAREHAKHTLTDKILTDVDQSMGGGGMAGAPVILVVCGDPVRTFPSTMESSLWPCVQNLLLATHAEGLGASLTTMATLVPGALNQLLGIPAEITPYAVIPIGRPAHPLGRPHRRPVAELTHYDRWSG